MVQYAICSSVQNLFANGWSTMHISTQETFGGKKPKPIQTVSKILNSFHNNMRKQIPKDFHKVTSSKSQTPWFVKTRWSCFANRSELSKEPPKFSQINSKSCETRWIPWLAHGEGNTAKSLEKYSSFTAYSRFSFSNWGFLKKALKSRTQKLTKSKISWYRFGRGSRQRCLRMSQYPNPPRNRPPIAAKREE